MKILETCVIDSVRKFLLKYLDSLNIDSLFFIGLICNVYRYSFSLQYHNFILYLTKLSFYPIIINIIIVINSFIYIFVLIIIFSFLVFTIINHVSRKIRRKKPYKSNGNAHSIKIYNLRQLILKYDLIFLVIFMFTNFLYSDSKGHFYSIFKFEDTVDYFFAIIFFLYLLESVIIYCVKIIKNLNNYNILNSGNNTTTKQSNLHK